MSCYVAMRLEALIRDTDTLQGYYISKPLPGEAFLAWLRESEWG